MTGREKDTAIVMTMEMNTSRPFLAKPNVNALHAADKVLMNSMRGCRKRGTMGIKSEEIL